jgi:hypothetical protein
LVTVLLYRPSAFFLNPAFFLSGLGSCSGFVASVLWIGIRKVPE